MNEDRFTLTTFKNRRVPIGTRLDLTWEELWDRFHNPEVTEETVEEYSAMTNEQKTDVKDVGGYIAGEFKGNRRSKAALVSRQIITIDADYATENGLKTFMCMWCGSFLAHTTHTSTRDNLRLRYLFPLTRPVNPDEYRYLANYLAEAIGLESIDESTDQPERLMFWPSVSFDGYYECWGNKDGPFLDPDSLLPKDLPISAPVKPAKPVSSGVLTIAEGQRNKTVFSFAATLRGNGLDQAGIRAMLDEYNERYCEPPLDSFELDTITRSVCSRYEAGAAIASSLRDAWDDFNDMGEWKESKKEGQKAPAMSFSELSSRKLSPPTFLVDGLITNGLTLLVSPPKFGKSWMCMDLAMSVATGTSFLGFKTVRKGVIYYALEDGDYRLQDRGKKVAGNREYPSNLYLLKEAPTFDEGLLQEIYERLKECGDIGLVIIDTLQRVRGFAKRTEGAYGYDYREVGKIQKFAMENNIAIVLVHHTNKSSGDNDVMNSISGTNGIFGAADASLLLTRSKRGDKETLMHTSGRDIGYRTFVITMPAGQYRWQLIGEEQDADERREELEFREDPLVQTIVRRLDEAEELVGPDDIEVSWSCTTAQFLDEVKRLYGDQHLSPQAVGQKLSKMEPRLLDFTGVTHKYERNMTARLHVFTREII